MLGCSFDSVEDQKAFADKFRFPFPLLSDTDRKTGIAYGACDSPGDEYARRIAYLIGKDGTILEAHENVNAARFPDEQLRRLAEREGT